MKSPHSNVGLHPGAAAKIEFRESNVGLHPGAAAKIEFRETATMCGNKLSPNSEPLNDKRMHRGASLRKFADTDNNKLPVRKNIRATFHNYSGGDYFVTICTQNKEHYFGKIRNNEMLYSTIGAEAYRCMETLASHYQYVEVPLFVIMPNHVHAIIRIREQEDAPGCIPTIRTALGVVVGGYKQSVTRFARRNNIEFDWQSRYHDHIIRGTYDGNRIADYIQNNVARWANDCFYE